MIIDGPLDLGLPRVSEWTSNKVLGNISRRFGPQTKKIEIGINEWANRMVT
jgi:hypothetical protein